MKYFNKIFNAIFAKSYFFGIYLFIFFEYILFYYRIELYIS